MKTVKEILAERYNDNYLSKHDPRFGAKFPPEKDIPAVINLKRKAIRIFPDGQKIALYYSPQLDRYVSIPYGPGTQASGIQINERKTDDEFELDVSDKLKQLYTRYKKKSKGKLVSKKDILNLIPLHKVAAISPGQAALRAVRQSEPGNYNLLAGQLAGLGAAKLFNVIKARPKSVSESFKSKLNYLKEEELIKEEFRLLEEKLPHLTEEEQLNEILSIIGKYGLGKALQYAGKSGKKLLKKAGRKIASVGSRAKKWAKGKLLSFGTGAAAGGALFGGGDESVGGLKDVGSAYEYAKAAGEKSTTQKKPVEFRLQPKISGGYTPSQDIYTQQQSFGGRKFTATRTQQESTNFDKIKMIAENNIKTDSIFFGDNSITINNRIAKKLINVYESLNKDNRKKVEEMINEDVNSFKKLINFAIRQ